MERLLQLLDEVDDWLSAMRYLLVSRSAFLGD